MQVLNGPPETLSPSIKEYTAASLWNLARDDPSKATARQEGAMVALVRLLQDPSEGVVENAAGSLLSLTINAENRDHIQQIGGIHQLVCSVAPTTLFCSLRTARRDCQPPTANRQPPKVVQ